VPSPDNPECIAQKAIQALEERDRIIHSYAEYAPMYNRKAIQSISEFLEYPVELIEGK
jgi:hypothetical protein